MRATTAFNKIVAPLGVTVVDVVFESDSVILTVRSRRRRLHCLCGWSTSAIYDRSVRRWRHLDALGTKVVLQGEIRRLGCGRCGRVVTEQVVSARHGARHTRLFDDVVAWWCQRADRTSVAAFLRCDWATVTAIAARVVADNLHDGRFDGLTRIGVDEISWSKGHFSGVGDLSRVVRREAVFSRAEHRSLHTVRHVPACERPLQTASSRLLALA
ncbi:MAG: helix-turn-helix domain-containing protein [Acidimicrobiales bacterium]